MTYKQTYALIQALRSLSDDVERIKKFGGKSWMKKVDECASSITKHGAKPEQNRIKN